MRCPTGNGRGQFTTVKANSSEKSKTICNNSYIRLDLQKKILSEQELKGRYTPKPHISRKYRVYSEYLDKLQASALRIYTKKTNSYTRMFGKELFLSFMDTLHYIQK